MSETTPLIKAALNLRVGAGFDVYNDSQKPKGYLYTRRNYWEANKEYDKALEINQVIMNGDNSGDARAAERVYDSKKRN